MTKAGPWSLSVTSAWMPLEPLKIGLASVESGLASAEKQAKD